jgi:hypothetical protein
VFSDSSQVHTINTGVDDTHMHDTERKVKTALLIVSKVLSAPSSTTPSFFRSPTTAAFRSCLSPYLPLFVFFHASGNRGTRFRPSKNRLHHRLLRSGKCHFQAMLFSPILRYFGARKANVVPMSTLNRILLLFPMINTVPPRPIPHRKK